MRQYSGPGGALRNAISVLFLVLVISGLEGAARIFYDRSHLEQIVYILERDPDLIWKNRPRLHERFIDTGISTDRNGFRSGAKEKRMDHGAVSARHTIVCMGASPTFGWGVDYGQTYTAVLEKSLRKEYGEDFLAVNAGMIGYSSFQGKKLLEKAVLPLKPELITVSYVINDIDKYRFFLNNGRPDSALKRQNGFISGLLNVLDRSYFFMAYKKMLNGFRDRKKYAGGVPVETYLPREVRVSADEYRSNLEDIIDICARRDIKLLFIKFPVNLPIPEHVPGSLREKAESLVSDSLSMIKKEDYHGAIGLLEEAVKNNKYLSSAYYYLGFCYNRTGDHVTAESYFTRILEIEAYRCGEYGLEYNRIIEDVAHRRGIPLSDIPAAFSGYAAEYLFLDPQKDTIHPNAKGHLIIAACISDTIRKNGLLFSARGKKLK